MVVAFITNFSQIPATGTGRTAHEDPSLVSEVARAGELGHSGLELTTNLREDFIVLGEVLY